VRRAHDGLDAVAIGDAAQLEGVLVGPGAVVDAEKDVRVEVYQGALLSPVRFGAGPGPM